MAYDERGEFVKLEFRLADAAYPAIRISQELGCHLELLDAIRSNGRMTTAFFHVLGGNCDRILEQGQKSKHEDEISIIERYDDECVVEVTLNRSLFRTLARARIPLRSLEVSDGSANVVATIPPDRDPEEIVSLVKQNHPSVTLVRKHRTDIAAPFITRSGFQTLLNERLTDRQWTALSLAFNEGYFERPRSATQQDLCETMDISSSTFGQHLHTALRKLLAAVFTTESPQSDPANGSGRPD
jgi:predicted DNA binding protein